MATLSRSARLGLHELDRRDVPALLTRPYSPFGEETRIGISGDPVVGAPVSSALDTSREGDTLAGWVQSDLTAPFLPGGGEGLYVRPFSKTGAAGAVIMLVASDRDQTGIDVLPREVDVSADRDGYFTAAYTVSVLEYDPPGTMISWTDRLYAQRITPAGSPTGAAVLLAEVGDDEPADLDTHILRTPVVASPDTGQAVVAWADVLSQSFDIGVPAPRFQTDTTIYTRGVDWTAGTLTSVSTVRELTLERTETGSSYTGRINFHLAIDAPATGGAVIVWPELQAPSGANFQEDPELDTVYARQYTAGAVPVGGPIAVTQRPAGTQVDAGPAAVGVDDVGNFVVTWAYIPKSGVSEDFGVFARRFSAAGVPLADEFKVDDRNEFSWPDVGVDAAGNFVIAWDGAHNPGNNEYGVVAKAFTAAGVQRGNQMLLRPVSLYASPIVSNPMVSLDKDGDMTVGWVRTDYGLGQPTVTDIYARRFVRADFEVQQGEVQRSFVRRADIDFNSGAVDLPAVAAGGRVRLTRYELDGSGPGDVIGLSGAVSATGNRLTIDVGSAGLADGYYSLQADLNGDGLFEADWRFFRLFGDADGSGAVDATDYAAFDLAFGTTVGDPLYLAYFDFDQDGQINMTDYAAFDLRYGVYVDPWLDWND